MEFSDFLNKLNCFLNDSGLSQTALASLASVPQSQVSEWVNNRRGVRVGKNARRVLNVINEHYRSGLVPIPEDIEAAIRKIWNGDPERAGIIVSLIESIGPAFEK